MDIEPKDFKAAMRLVKTSITVVSTVDLSGKLFGLTVNSFTSVSLAPPLVLFCLTYKSSSLAAVRSSKKFAVNLLNREQESVARNFAMPLVDKFADLKYNLDQESGLPLIADAIWSIECSLEHEYKGGDHAIIVGKVQKMTAGNDKPVLTYHAGLYS